MDKPFWQSKSLFEMSTDEWEALCDGCAKCCLVQLEDEESGQLVFTDVACDLLNAASCRCSDYPNRSRRVPTCMTMNRENVVHCAEFAPPSCSYRLLLENKPLPEWHHLLTGDTQSIHRAGASVQGRIRFHHEVDDDRLEDFVVDWVEQDADSK